MALPNICIFFNGFIYPTADNVNYSAMACLYSKQNNKHNASATILELGTDEFLLNKYKNIKPQLIDLQNKTVFPGFTDSHVHLLGYAKSFLEANFTSDNSLEQSLKTIINFAKNNNSPWLTGNGWDKNLWPEQISPNKHHLDSLTINKPIMFKSKDWHSIWLNTQALNVLNISADTLHLYPTGIEIDAQGNPTGIIQEAAAFYFLEKTPQPNTSDITNAVFRVQQELFSYGITSVHAMESLEGFATIVKVAEHNNYLLNTHTYLMTENIQEVLNLKTKNDSPYCSIAGIKLFMDGSLGSQTAFMNKPYDNTNNSGQVLYTETELKKIITEANAAQLPCAVHAIGDKANNMVLNAFENSSTHKCKNRIEHCQLLLPSDLSRFAQLNIIASVQPRHLLDDIDLINKYWKNRASHAYAFGALKQQKANIIFGSDAPIASAHPWKAIATAVTRRKNNIEFYTKQCLSIQSAIEAYTSAPAFAVSQQNSHGQLLPKYSADFVVLNTNPFSTANFEDLKIEATYIGGKLVYEASKI